MGGECLRRLVVIEGDEGIRRHEGFDQTALQDNRDDFTLVALGPELLGDVVLTDGILKGDVEEVTEKETVGYGRMEGSGRGILSILWAECFFLVLRVL